MAEYENQMVDRMKAEGQLTRNSGTNSLKAIRVDLSKFDSVFESINKNLVMQSSFLESIYNLEVDRLSMARERQEDIDRADDLIVDDASNDSRASEASESDSKDSDDKDKDDDGGFLKKLFTGSVLGKLAIGAIATPFVWRFMRGFIDQITGGKFSEFEAIVTDTLPDLFNNAREALRLVYTNINSFLDTGNLQDLFKDEEGNNIFDIQAITDKALQWGTVAASYFLFGPLGAIKSGMTASLLNTIEDLTGFDIPPEIETALTLLMGVPGSGRLAARGALTSARIVGSVGRSLIGTAIRAVALNPVAALAIGAGALVAWAGTRLYDTIQEYNATQVEADRIMQNARDQLAIQENMVDPLEDQGESVAETGNEGLTSGTNIEQLSRAIAGILPMIDTPDGQRKLRFDELSEEDRQAVMQQALENIRPWMDEQFQRLNTNNMFYSNLIDQLIDNDGVTSETWEQLDYFLELARRQAEAGDIAGAAAYNNIVSGIQNQLSGVSMSEIEEEEAAGNVAAGFAQWLRDRGFAETISKDNNTPMLDFEAMQRRLEDATDQVGNNATAGPDDGLRGGSVLLNNGGNTIRQGDQVSSNTVTIIAPTQSSSSLENSSGVINAFA